MILNIEKIQKGQLLVLMQINIKYVNALLSISDFFSIRRMEVRCQLPN